MSRVIIIGGGAAGILAAVSADSDEQCSSQSQIFIQFI